MTDTMIDTRTVWPEADFELVPGRKLHFISRPVQPPTFQSSQWNPVPPAVVNDWRSKEATLVRDTVFDSTAEAEKDLILVSVEDENFWVPKSCVRPAHHWAVGDRVQVLPHSNLWLNRGRSSEGWSGRTGEIISGVDPDRDVKVRWDDDDSVNYICENNLMRAPAEPVGEAASAPSEPAVSAGEAELRRKVEELERQVRSERALVRAAQCELEEFKQSVIDTAREYAERHDWCEAVDEALTAMGLEIPRKAVTMEVRVTYRITATANVTGSKVTDDFVRTSLTFDEDKPILDHDFEGDEVERIDHEIISVEID